MTSKTVSALKLLFATALCFIIVRETILHFNTIELSILALSKLFSLQFFIYLVSAVILVFINWGLEIYKWQVLVNSVVAIKFYDAVKAVMSGVSISLFMPNRTGEFAGRILFVPADKRIETTVVTFYGSLIQLVITLAFGIVSYFVLQHYHHFSIPFVSALFLQINLPVLLIIVVGLILISFFFRKKLLVLFHSVLLKLKYIKISPALHAKVWFLSALRFIVFTMQFVLLMLAFGVQGNLISFFCGASFILFATTILPSISVLEIPLRGGISFLVMNSFSTYASGASVASLLLWCINLGIPAVFGAIILMFFKFDKWN
ncbi:MAG: hypothetical protein IPP29_18015 [Bacteroidetes bacterium]|nr:hypothetical protein [Bacteroidota bacterium]